MREGLWLRTKLRDLRDMRVEMGRRATEPGKMSDLEKRQTLFESEAVEFLKSGLEPDMILEAEGYNPVGPRDAKWIVGVDPTDGTAGDARSAGAMVINHLPVSAVMSLRKNIPNPTFASVVCAGMIDLSNNVGEIFLADDKLAYIPGQFSVMEPISQYNIHAPAVATEIARRANSFLRFLIPYGIYPETISDSHSSAMVMLWVLRGYIDLYWNSNLPGISGAGQRGYELGAMSVFARAMGACALQTKVEDNQVVVAGPLDDAPYTFDGQTPVILGPNRKIVDHYLGLINGSLKREINFGTGYPKCVAHVLSELYHQCPNERWSLPLIPEQPNV